MRPRTVRRPGSAERLERERGRSSPGCVRWCRRPPRRSGDLLRGRLHHQIAPRTHRPRSRRWLSPGAGSLLQHQPWQSGAATAMADERAPRYCSRRAISSQLTCSRFSRRGRDVESIVCGPTPTVAMFNEFVDLCGPSWTRSARARARRASRARAGAGRGRGPRRRRRPSRRSCPTWNPRHTEKRSSPPGAARRCCAGPRSRHLRRGRAGRVPWRCLGASAGRRFSFAEAIDDPVLRHAPPQALIPVPRQRPAEASARSDARPSWPPSPHRLGERAPAAGAETRPRSPDLTTGCGAPQSRQTVSRGRISMRRRSVPGRPPRQHARYSPAARIFERRPRDPCAAPTRRRPAASLTLPAAVRRGPCRARHRRACVPPTGRRPAGSRRASQTRGTRAGADAAGPISLWPSSRSEPPCPRR